MHLKIVEILDRHTCIPALAIRMMAEDAVQSHYLHGRAGYPVDGSAIVLMKLSDQKAAVDLYDWFSLGSGRRTMQVAHQYIAEHFDELADGDVVDVQFILGESSAPKIAERLGGSHPPYRFL